MRVDFLFRARDELDDRFRTQRVASLNRRFARRLLERKVEQVGAVDLSFPLAYRAENRHKDFDGRQIAQDCRIAVHNDARAAEFLDRDAKL